MVIRMMTTAKATFQLFPAVLLIRMAQTSRYGARGTGSSTQVTARVAKREKNRQLARLAVAASCVGKGEWPVEQALVRSTGTIGKNAKAQC